MREAWVIAKREFLERVRTKWFVVITLLGPLLMVALIVVPVLLEGAGIKGAKVDIVDRTGQVGDTIAQALATAQNWKTRVVPATTTEDELKRRIREREINGWIDIPEDALTSKAVHATYKGDNASNTGVGVVVQVVVQQVLIDARARRAQLTDEQRDAVTAAITVKPLHTNGKSDAQSGMATFFLGYAIAMILYMVISLYGVNVMRSVVTEKSSRVMELMVAASRPRSLMTGKIVGVGGAGLTQIAIWLAIGGLALANRDALLSAIGIHTHGGASSIPPLSIEQILVIVVFFVLGFTFYSTIFAALGATVSNEQDSQQAQIPVMMLLVVGLVSMTAITGDPRGSTAQLLTIIPFWSPMLMPLRYLLGGATPGEVAVSIGVLVASALLIARAAAKIYRVGILMYGKRPGLSELIRWLRY